MMLTYKYRIKDGSSGTRNALMKQARAVNYVWNYLCDVQRHAQKWQWRWPSYFDLTKLTSSSGLELGLQSVTVSAVCNAFVAARNARGRCPRFRGRKSLPWVPFRHGYEVIRVTGAVAVFRKRKYRLWLSREIPGTIKEGSFGCDARGRWYLNLACDIAEQPLENSGQIGIDLGLKSFASMSDGTEIEAPRLFRKYEDVLAVAQRAGHKTRAKAIHAKIVNARKDFLHKLSTKLVRQYGTIVVGDASASQLKQTKMAKSVSDASWYAFKTMLAYKATKHRVRFIEANEAYSSQTCSNCGVISGPKGRKGLAVRSWDCSSCGVTHLRDVNAAKNILMIGTKCRPPAAGIAA